MGGHLLLHVPEEALVPGSVGRDLGADRLDGGVDEQIEDGQEPREDPPPLGVDEVAPFDGLDGPGRHRGDLATIHSVSTSGPSARAKPIQSKNLNCTLVHLVKRMQRTDPMRRSWK